MAGAKGGKSKSTKQGRSPVLYSRPPLERMMEIHESVKQNNYPNASTLAKKLEVSTNYIMAKATYFIIYHFCLNKY